MSDGPKIASAAHRLEQEARLYGLKGGKKSMPISAGHSRAVRKMGEFELFIKGATKRRRHTKWT